MPRLTRRDISEFAWALHNGLECGGNPLDVERRIRGIPIKDIRESRIIDSGIRRARDHMLTDRPIFSCWECGIDCDVHTCNKCEEYIHSVVYDPDALHGIRAPTDAERLVWEQAREERRVLSGYPGTLTMYNEPHLMVK